MPSDFIQGVPGLHGMDTETVYSLQDVLMNGITQVHGYEMPDRRFMVYPGVLNLEPEMWTRSPSEAEVMAENKRTDRRGELFHAMDLLDDMDLKAPK